MVGMSLTRMMIRFGLLVLCLCSSACALQPALVNPSGPDGVTLESPSTSLSSCSPASNGCMAPVLPSWSGPGSTRDSASEIALNSHLPCPPLPWEPGAPSQAGSEDQRRAPRESVVETDLATPSPCQPAPAAPYSSAGLGHRRNARLFVWRPRRLERRRIPSLVLDQFRLQPSGSGAAGASTYSLNLIFGARRRSSASRNSGQGVFDFSKREFDFNAGFAWNYFGSWEARAFAYSFNNLNRGWSEVAPAVSMTASDWRTAIICRPFIRNLGLPHSTKPEPASLRGVGYYPTKSMINAAGHVFDLKAPRACVPDVGDSRSQVLFV